MPWWFRFAAASWPPFFSRSCRCRADALLELLDQNLIEISKFLVHIFNLIKISRAIAVRIMDKPGLFGLLLGKIVALVGVTHKFWINTPFGRLDLINLPAALVSDHLNHICFLPGVLNRRCFCSWSLENCIRQGRLCAHFRFCILFRFGAGRRRFDLILFLKSRLPLRVLLLLGNLRLRGSCWALHQGALALGLFSLACACKSFSCLPQRRMHSKHGHGRVYVGKT